MSCGSMSRFPQISNAGHSDSWGLQLLECTRSLGRLVEVPSFSSEGRSRPGVEWGLSLTSDRQEGTLDREGAPRPP